MENLWEVSVQEHQYRNRSESRRPDVHLITRRFGMKPSQWFVGVDWTSQAPQVCVLSQWATGKSPLLIFFLDNSDRNTE